MFSGLSSQTVCINGKCKEVNVKARTNSKGQIIRSSNQREYDLSSASVKPLPSFVSPFLQDQSYLFRNSKGRIMPSYPINQSMKCTCSSPSGCSNCV